MGLGIYVADCQAGSQGDKGKTLGSPTVALGRGGATLGEPLSHYLYISVFTPHFFSLPGGNPAFLRKLYVEHGLSSHQIEKLTDNLWPQSTLVTALKNHKIIRPQISNTTKYGEKIVSLQKVPHLGEQKIIQQILQLKQNNHSFGQVARVLNKQGLRKRSSSPWDTTTIANIYNREIQNQQKMQLQKEQP